ncbi:YbjQ family protein [Litorivivens sp.]|uniref:YbjQ family protein n=1 Tax=Litorivivens sp. TaxID=2020868 RepID=UPI003564B263
MTDLVVFLVLLTLGFVFGRLAESRHFKSIQKRERELATVLAFSERLPPPTNTPRRVALVGGNVVISVDYFKMIAAGLRSLFGGRVRSFESLVERARREALLRMKQEALELGAAMVVNVKLETASISKGSKGQIGAVEVYAYGTALIDIT